MDPIHPPAIVRFQADLRILVNQAKADFQAGMACLTRGPEHFRRLGETLLEIKAIVGHGHWLPTLRDRLPFSERQAQKYMQLAKAPDKADLGAAWRIISGAAASDDGEDAEPDGESDADGAPRGGQPDATGSGDEHELDRPSGGPDSPASDADETVIVDAQGEPVPEQARAAFLGAGDVAAVGRAIEELARRIQELSESPAGRLIPYEDVKLHLRNAKAAVTPNRPTHVCPLCRGRTPDCPCCRGSGWTAEHVWRRVTEGQAGGQRP
jgi:hypothetical protein